MDRESLTDQEGEGKDELCGSSWGRTGGNDGRDYGGGAGAYGKPV